MAPTERQKMLANQPYWAADAELTAMRLAALQQLYRLNHSAPTQTDLRQAIARSLFGAMGLNSEIIPPFHCDYGCHIRAGDNLYINVNCTLLDCNWVTLGDNVLLAPNVQIYTAYHPVEPTRRQTGVEMAAQLPSAIMSGLAAARSSVLGSPLATTIPRLTTPVPAPHLAFAPSCKAEILGRPENCVGYCSPFGPMWSMSRFF